jgi:chromosome segregation ATPase
MRLGQALVVLGAPCLLFACDKAKADWAKCQSGETRDQAMVDCQNAVAKDPQSRSGHAAAEKLREMETEIAREDEEHKAAALLREFQSQASDINDLLQTSRARAAGGRPDQADKALSSVEATLDKYSATTVMQSTDYVELRKNVAKSRADLKPALDRWKEQHPTIDDLIARCQVQRDEVETIDQQADDANHRRSGQSANEATAQLNVLVPKLQAAVERYSATVNKLTALHVSAQLIVKYCQFHHPLR